MNLAIFRNPTLRNFYKEFLIEMKETLKFDQNVW